MIDLVFNLIQIGVLLFSVVMHEVAHGWTAFKMGDPTAKYEGRLTLNPIKHMDPVGSVLVPLLTFFLPGPVFGWAKPVPINPYNFSDRRRGEILVSLAGPASNMILGIVAGLSLRVVPPGNLGFYLLQYLSIINIFLAFFNLTPIPPLDGSHILINIWPGDRSRIRYLFQRYGSFLLIIFLVLGIGWLSPVSYKLFHLVSGY